LAARHTAQAKITHRSLRVFTDASLVLVVEHGDAQAGVMKTILIAEDEASAITLYLAAFSSRPDWNVVIARTGQEALDLAHSLLPSLALLDIRMPLVDGIDVCR
jgi:PleD family two-component response regulator